jgi:hypothetical protein
LVVDPDRALPLAVARQYLETVAWRRPQVAEIARGVEVAQFPARHLDQIGRKALRTFAVEDGFGGLSPEAPDHRQCVSFNDTDVKVRVLFACDPLADVPLTAQLRVLHRDDRRAVIEFIQTVTVKSDIGVDTAMACWIVKTIRQ